MNDHGCGLAALTIATRDWLVSELDLQRIPLAPEFEHATGSWAGAPVNLETRAYEGDCIRFACFTVARGEGFELGTLLCLPAIEYPLPILGGDLVARDDRERAITIDLAPVLPPGPSRDAQLATLASRRARHPELPPGKPLPAERAACASPYVLATCGCGEELRGAERAAADFARVLASLVRDAEPEPAQAGQVRSAQEEYLAAQRADGRVETLLAELFDADWASRYVRDALFPAEAVPA